MYYIYKLTDCNGLTYYGSSENVDERFKGHMKPNNKCSSNKLDRLSMKVEVIETLPIGSTENEAKWRERWYFDNNDCVNEDRPIVTDEERIQKQKECSREYRQKPEVKEKQKEYGREYYNKPEVKARKKEYRQKNADIIKEQKKEQYNQKKERNLMGLEDKY
jgi:hypothetical protein